MYDITDHTDITDHNNNKKNNDKNTNNNNNNNNNNNSSSDIYDRISFVFKTWSGLFLLIESKRKKYNS